MKIFCHNKVSCPQPESSRFQTSRRGMALVITLIMLSVTLIMAIAFLAISRRERISVGSSTDTTVARFATDIGLAAAESQILANILSTNAAFYSYNLLVSTNYINPNGFNNTLLPSPYNVSYYYANGNVLVGADFAQNVANLQILPRAPVMVSGTDPAGRFYLDLNRNGVFEDTGDGVPNAVMDTGPVVNSGSGHINFVTGKVSTNGPFTEVGDPQWVGVLERPGLPHGPDNKFTARYAFIALPVGESLDLNAGHNQAVTQRVNPLSGGIDGYMRNQGVGSWEINFAAFFADLNTNQWLPGAPPYNLYYAYNEPFNFANTGLAFEDARALLSYRYNFLYTSLASASQTFSPLNFGRLRFDNIDEYSDGLLQTNTQNIIEVAPNQDKVAQPWAGADNPNKFFTPSDFFQTNRTLATTLANRLVDAGATAAADGAHPTYDRYTFYRMLNQLGTDTLPDSVGKLNLNYSNAVVNYDVNGLYTGTTLIPGAETNMVDWRPLDFYCAAADQILKVYTTNWFQAGPSNYLVTYYNIHYPFPIDRYTGFGLTNTPFLGMTNQVPAFGLTNIPVQVNGSYVHSPAVNRLLQLAANIYDASDVSITNMYPHVFRPIFRHTVANVFIVGYEPVVLDGRPFLDSPTNVEALFSIYPADTDIHGNVYGVPWIIGAKKYLPNFSQFYSYNSVQVGRKIQVTRKSAPSSWPGPSPDFYATNQMIAISITNYMGCSFWNSYVSNYSGVAPQVFVHNSLAMRLSQRGTTYSYSGGGSFIANSIVPYNPAQPGVWPGSGKGVLAVNPSASAFVYTNCNYTFVAPSALDLDNNGNINPANPSGLTAQAFNPSIKTIQPFPQLELDTTNYFQAYILDNGHVIDYVQFAGPVSVANLGDTSHVNDPNSLANQDASQWSTNAFGAGFDGVNMGVLHQIDVSKNGPAGYPGIWKSLDPLPNGVSGTAAEAAHFKGFFQPIWTFGTPAKMYVNTNLIDQAPFTPSRTVLMPVLWVANDPLVHYLSTDLNTALPVNAAGAIKDFPTFPLPSQNAIQQPSPLVERYQPWGQDVQLKTLFNDSHVFQYNLALKDPLVLSPDSWDFPMNKYPSVGWLGRVHRGTPWQTVYLKATDLMAYVNTAIPATGFAAWTNWTGNVNSFDANNSSPVTDRLLFDIFTASPNENASRGTLSVNQTHLAAWSALLSGIMVPTSLTNTYEAIQPAGPGTGSPLWQIFNQTASGALGITLARTNYPGGVFKHVGDILSAPALTENSPFITGLGLNTDVSDELYEWLPQQIMGLLRSSGPPRYVIYTYGQTLKPAPDGTVLSSALLAGGVNPFGLVTNYQVVAESATRAVVTVLPSITNTPAGPVTNYNLKVDSFNVLPPD